MSNSVFHATPIFKKGPQLVALYDELHADENAQWVSTKPSRQIWYVFVNCVNWSPLEFLYQVEQLGKWC